MVTGGPVCRPYGIPETLVYFVGADGSAARLFTEDSPLPAGGASPSPTVSLKGSTYFVGTKHSAGGEIGDGRPGVPPLRHTRNPHAFRRGRRLSGPPVHERFPITGGRGKPLPYRVFKRSQISRRGQAQPPNGRLCFSPPEKHVSS